MSAVQLRARSATELIDAAFQLLRREPLKYIMVSALAYVPWLVIMLAFFGSEGAVDPTALSVIPMLIVSAGSLVTYSIMSAMIVRISADAYLGRTTDVGTALREVLPHLWELIIAGIAKAFLLALGFLALLVGALYVAARFFAVNQAIVLEGLNVGRAFERSSELSKGRKRHVLATLILAVVIFVILSFAVGLLSAVTQNLVIINVANTLYTIVAYPLFAITEMLLYYDARVRGEGFDIEVMAGALEGGAAADRAIP